MRSIKFLLANRPAALADALKGKASATVEAEYGSVTVEGSIITMAHHGENAGNPAPCSYGNEVGKGVEVAGLSHFDLDTLGGCMALLGVKPEAPAFWALSEFVDLNGPHQLQEGVEKTGAGKTDVDCLYAFWAWSQQNRVFANRDGSVSDVTTEVIKGVQTLTKILEGDEVLLATGSEFRKAEDELNESSFVVEEGGVIVRIADAFTNHLYVTPDGAVCKAVVALNNKFGSVTVSFADGAISASKNAREIVQAIFPDCQIKIEGEDDPRPEIYGSPEEAHEAAKVASLENYEILMLSGGHAGIAGSPRGRTMTREDLDAALEATVAALS